MAGAWEWYETQNGSPRPEKELEQAKLSKTEKTQLANLLERIETGRVLKKDVKYISNYDLYEARLDGDHRIFRLLYAQRSDGTKLIAALFTSKKSRKLPTTTFKTAQSRIADWDSRHPAD